MGRKLYIADWHYGHANIVAYDDRPFKDALAMDAALVANWQRTVRPDDQVYVLGDMFWGNPRKAIPVLDSLPGSKILVKGNHDKTNDPGFASQFEAIDEYMEIADGRDNLVLCHYPIPCYKNHFHGWYHLYAHVHDAFEAKMMEHQRRLMEDLYCRPHNMINVGAMMPWMDYTPRTLAEIKAGYEAWRNQKGGAPHG